MIDVRLHHNSVAIRVILANVPILMLFTYAKIDYVKVRTYFSTKIEYG